MEPALLLHRLPLRLAAARLPPLLHPPQPQQQQQQRLAAFRRRCSTPSRSQASDSIAASAAAAATPPSSSPYPPCTSPPFRKEYHQLEGQLPHGHEADASPSTSSTMPSQLLPSLSPTLASTSKISPSPSSTSPPPPLSTTTSLSSSSPSPSLSQSQSPSLLLSPSLENVSCSSIDRNSLECCEVGEKLNIGVLLSGGVDSSVALRLLLAAGHSCTAFYLKIWFQEDFENFWSECPWDEDLKFAQAVCDEVGVNLQVVQLTNEYWEHVVSHMIAEYSAGRTPNPDVLCNSRIKFGVFLDHVKDMGFDRVASGHYAKVIRTAGETLLHLSRDEVKDQTYFLSHLSQSQLSKLTFPLGCLSKDEVRKIADELGLPNKQRKDSQGICFLGKVKFSDFICRHLGEREGNILEAETGKYLGTHKGFWFYTIGQRQGLRLSDGPWYVVDKDLENNVVFVSKEYYSADKRRRLFKVHTFNWLGGQPPRSFSGLKCKVRHGTRFYHCSLTFQNIVSTFQTTGESDVALVELSEDDQGIAAGQYAAFYKGDVCLGSAVISEFKDQSSAVSSRAREAARVKGVPLLSTRKSEKKKIASHQCDNIVARKTAGTQLSSKGPTWLLHNFRGWVKKCFDWFQTR